MPAVPEHARDEWQGECTLLRYQRYQYYCYGRDRYRHGDY